MTTGNRQWPKKKMWQTIGRMTLTTQLMLSLMLLILAARVKRQAIMLLPRLLPQVQVQAQAQMFGRVQAQGPDSIPH